MDILIQQKIDEINSTISQKNFNIEQLNKDMGVIRELLLKMEESNIKHGKVQAEYQRLRQQFDKATADIGLEVVSVPQIPQSNPTPTPVPAPTPEDTFELNIWWPTNDYTFPRAWGPQTFKGELKKNGEALPLNQYEMAWDVGATKYDMYSATNNIENEGPHKTHLADLSAWTWKGNGPYPITFKATHGSAIIEKAVNVNFDTTPTATIVTQPTPQPMPVSGNPFNGKTLYVDPDSLAYQWCRANPGPEADLIEANIASIPSFVWIGEWSGDVRNTVKSIVDRGGDTLKGCILYNIPYRDLGHYSKGGLENEEAYKAWIDQVVEGANGKQNVFIIEPDALPGLDGLTTQEAKDTRLRCLKYAIDSLANNGQFVYLDMGNYSWHSADTMATRYNLVGTTLNRGFSCNVSGFGWQSDSENFARRLHELTGKPSIVDTSRNGNGPWSGDNESWCNPPGRKLGYRPAVPNLNHIDANVWAKKPGESDGTCHGGPNAGTFWPEFALGLI